MEQVSPRVSCSQSCSARCGLLLECGCIQTRHTASGGAGSLSQQQGVYAPQAALPDDRKIGFGVYSTYHSTLRDVAAAKTLIRYRRNRVHRCNPDGGESDGDGGYLQPHSHRVSNYRPATCSRSETRARCVNIAGRGGWSQDRRRSTGLD